MRTPRIVGIGELLWDRLPSGARLGGATTNFSVFCSRLGNHASLISSVGDDVYGNAAKENLAEPQLDLSMLQTDAGHATGTVEVSFSQDRQPSYTIATEVAWDFIRTVPEMRAMAASADAAYFGTLSQRYPVSRAAIRGFIESTPADCVRVCDINLRLPFCSGEVLRWSMSHATIIKVSDEELASVFSLLKDSTPAADEKAIDPQPAVERLLASFPHCAMVALTLGAKGCLLVTRSEHFADAGIPIELVDAVGAGDAFTAGITHAYLRGAPLPVIAAVGNLCGSFVASQHGATPHLPEWLNQRVTSLLENETGRGHAPGLHSEVTHGSS